ncbi:endonuclease V [Nanoarchaeota archaeon]
MEDKLRVIQRNYARSVTLNDSPELNEVTRIGAFDVAYFKDKLICAACVMKYPSMEVLEKKTLVLGVPMKYVPGFLAFREGPAILQLFYDLEYDPQIIFIDGHGIAHPIKAGLATYVGVELGKPTIGVAKKALFGEAMDDKLMSGDEQVGILVRTKEYANPLCVSPGNMVSINTAADWVLKTILPPHKKPEPLHIASRLAKKNAQRLETEN